VGLEPTKIFIQKKNLLTKKVIAVTLSYINIIS
jgi:hypothetical protein